MVQRELHDDTDTWRILIERGLIVACLWPGATHCPDDTLVTFCLDTICYGIPAHLICSIQPLTNYIPLPFTQPFIVGVVYVQDRLVAMLDLRAATSPATAAMTERPDISSDSMLLIVKLEGMDAALLANTIIAAPHELWPLETC